MTPLKRVFYEASAREVAPLLLGHFLVRDTPEGQSGGMIVEVEAYLQEEPASHAFRGPTERNRSMFGPPGHAYVYFIYGMHFCVNAVCGPVGRAEAVLIRALEPRFDLERMRHRRGGVKDRLLARGPARLCQALGIDRTLDGVDLCRKGPGLWIARNPDRSDVVGDGAGIVVSRRIGITQAADLPLRYHVAGSPWVSRR